MEGSDDCDASNPTSGAFEKSNETDDCDLWCDEEINERPGTVNVSTSDDHSTGHGQQENERNEGAIVSTPNGSESNRNERRVVSHTTKFAATTRTTPEPRFRDNPGFEDDVTDVQHGWQGFFWKRARANDTVTAPRPRHVETVLRSGQAEQTNRRWTRFTRPGAVQMEGRAPYSGGFQWRILQTGALRQPRRQPQEQSLEPHTSGGAGSVEASHTPLQDVENREEQDVVLAAYVVDDSGREQDTVIEGMQVETIEKSQNDSAKPGLMGILSKRTMFLCILVLLSSVAAVISLIMILPGESVALQSPAVSDATNETIVAVVEDEFPVEFATAVENITSQTDLQLPGSPQNLAMKWILRHEPTRIRSPKDPRFLQRYIVGVFVYAAKLNENLPASFHLLDENIDECDWRGITCTDAQIVTRIDIVVPQNVFYNEAPGTLASELGYLPELRNLMCTGIELQGTIPSGLANASKLRGLYLPRNHLQSPFPESFQDHPSLEEVFLSGNRGFGGTIPDVLTKIRTLTQLGVNGCNLTGTIPSEIALLDTLTRLHVEDNELTGTLPSELGGLRNLEALHVSNNQLTGPLAEPIVMMLPQLQIAFFDRNQFTGQIPDSIPVPPEKVAFRARKRVYLHDNLLSGTIPSTLAHLAPMQNLTLHKNSFTGVMPSEICEVADLDHTGKFERLNLTADCSASDGPVEVDCMCCSACY